VEQCIRDAECFRTILSNFGIILGLTALSDASCISVQYQPIRTLPQIQAHI